ncbi:MAG: TolC family protein, partial [Cyclobacteriaceae bacterium]|nr:TolC family protein [Cyclobacteriaceae bacterium]
MNKYIFLFVSIIFTHEMSFAQESSVWDIKKCVDYALENNLNVKQSYSNVQIDEISLHQTRMNRLPSLNGSISYGSRWGRSIDPTSNLFSTQQIGFTTGSLSSNVVLFGGLRNSYSISQSEKFLESTKYSYDAERNNVILNVVTFYTNVILNQELYENAKAQLENTQQQLERTKKQVDVGALPISNLLEIQAQAATNELNLVNQENALNLSMLQLKQVMQLSSSEIITIETPELVIENEIILEYNIDEVYAMALQTMPEIKSAESFKEANEIGTKVSKGNLYPTLSLFAGLNSNYSTAADRLRFLPDGGVNVITNPEIGYVSGTGTPVLSNSNLEVPTGQFIDGYVFMDQMNDNLSKSVSLNLNIPIFSKFFNRD